MLTSLGLSAIEPLVPDEEQPLELGSGRIGTLTESTTFAKFADRAKEFLQAEGVKVVGEGDRSIRRVAVACGSAGAMLDDAIDRQCDTLVLGETTFHTCLHAEAEGVSLLLVGHFASERFAVEQLAARLDEQFPKIEVWASRRERNPIRWI